MLACISTMYVTATERSEYLTKVLRKNDILFVCAWKQRIEGTISISFIRIQDYHFHRQEESETSCQLQNILLSLQLSGPEFIHNNRVKSSKSQQT